MSSLVLELQQAAQNENESLSSVLRKALVVSRKLGLNDLSDWIDKELNGYGESDIPEYRKGHGQIKSYNMYSGWVPVIGAERLAQRLIGQSIAVLESQRATLKGTQFAEDVPDKMQMHLIQNVGQEAVFTLFLPTAIFDHIFSTVRNKILSWSLDLEAAGILGEGLTFNKEEKQAAQSVVYNIGTMSHSQIQSHSGGNQTMDNSTTINWGQVRDELGKLGQALASTKLDEATRQEAELHLQTAQLQAKAKAPQASMVKTALGSLKTVLEEAAGGVAAQGVIQAIPAILALLG